MIVPSSRLSRRRQWHPTPVLLPGKSHGWRSLVGCSPWGRQELDTTEWLHFHFSLSCIGVGMATHCCQPIVFAWRIPGMGSHRVGHNWSELAVSSSKVIRKRPWIPWLLQVKKAKMIGWRIGSGFCLMCKKIQFFTSGGQSTGVSASVSVLSINKGLISFRIDWFDLLAVQGTLSLYL